MIPFVDCNEAVFRGTLILLLLSAFVGVVCFAISLSYRLKLRYILPVPGRYAGGGDQAVLNLPGAPGREHRKKLKNSCYFSENRAIMMR